MLGWMDGWMDGQAFTPAAQGKAVEARDEICKQEVPKYLMCGWGRYSHVADVAPHVWCMVAAQQRTALHMLRASGGAPGMYFGSAGNADVPGPRTC